MEMLYCGRILNVEDLNRDEPYGSKGYGKVFMDSIKAEAKKRGCSQLQPDSGVQRAPTHRFYFREELTILCHPFHLSL
jgi:hypothetical protein